jgi:hypothetical protein
LVLRREARADLKQRLAIALGQLVEDNSPSRIGQRLEDIADAGLYARKRLHVKFGSISLASTPAHRPPGSHRSSTQPSMPVAHQRITLAWPAGRALVGLRDRRPESSLSGCREPGAQLER